MLSVAELCKVLQNFDQLYQASASPNEHKRTPLYSIELRWALTMLTEFGRSNYSLCSQDASLFVSEHPLSMKQMLATGAMICWLLWHLTGYRTKKIIIRLGSNYLKIVPLLDACFSCGRFAGMYYWITYFESSQTMIWSSLNTIFLFSTSLLVYFLSRYVTGEWLCVYSIIALGTVYHWQ